KFENDDIISKIKRSNVPVIMLLNKIDQAKGSQVLDKTTYWKEHIEMQEIIPISALEGIGITEVFDSILRNLPNHPAYFPKDQLTDKSERFFAAEIIREKIFQNYKKEVPYSTEVNIESFKE